jgi:TOBE domain
VSGGRANWLGQQVALNAPEGEVTMLCRPEDLRMDPSGIPGRVVRIMDLGPMLRVSVATDEGASLTWLCPRGEVPQAGASLSLLPTRLLVYQNGVRIGTAIPASQKALLESVSP